MEEWGGEYNQYTLYKTLKDPIKNIDTIIIITTTTASSVVKKVILMEFNKAKVGTTFG